MFCNGLVYWVVSSRTGSFWLRDFAALFVRGDTEVGVVFHDNMQNTEHSLFFFAQINELWGNFGNFDLKLCTKKQMQIKNRCHFYVAMRSSRENSGVPTLKIFDSKDLCFVSKLFSYNM